MAQKRGLQVARTKMKHQSSFSTETVYFSQMYFVKDIAELLDKNNKQKS